MDIKLCISGTPNGQDLFGDLSENRGFLEGLYTQTEPDSSRILIRNEEGVLCTYYIYIKYDNVKHFNERGGGYFAIALRVENAFCVESIELLNVLKRLYDTAIVGCVIESDINRRFIVPDFSSSDSQNRLNKIEKRLYDIIVAWVPRESYIDNISSSYIESTEKICINPVDCSDQIIHEYLRKGVEIVISDSYPTKKSSIENEEISRLKSECGSLKEQEEDFKNIINKKDDEIFKLNESLQENRKELDNIKLLYHDKQNKQNKKKVNKKQEKLSDSNIHKKTSKEKQRQLKIRKFRIMVLPWIIMICLIIVLILLICK